MTLTLRRLAASLSLVLLAGCQAVAPPASSTREVPATLGPATTTQPALALIPTLTVKGRGPRTGYSRAEFGPAWADVDRNGCDTRNDILNRDLTDKTYRTGTHDCVVLSGQLNEPYTGRVVTFAKAQASLVQIDHVVALSDAWQKGAAQWTADKRLHFANDPLNLLAVDGVQNQTKGDSDAASWLPPNKAFRCAYVSRQVAIKHTYGVNVTAAERDAMVRVLSHC